MSYICKSISSARIAIDENRLTIRAMQKLSANEYHFRFDSMERVIYGQRLNGMEKFLDKLDEIGVSRGSMTVVKEIKAGRLSILHKHAERTNFQFVDKAFDNAQLLMFFEVLDAHGVHIEAGGEWQNCR